MARTYFLKKIPGKKTSDQQGTEHGKTDRVPEVDLLSLFVSVIDEDHVLVRQVRAVDQAQHFLVRDRHFEQVLNLGFFRHGCY
jgi:hypothetical protein